MKSPFQGMDPFIEACGLWADFHNDLIAEIKRALAAMAPERYLVRTGERSYVVLVEEESKEKHRICPDVVISPPSERTDTIDSARALAEPAVEGGAVSLRAFIDLHYRETFVEIYEADPDQRLVTCIEVLSPSNKRRGSEGWEVYLRKRQALMLGAANLVEIDLLRGGTKLPMLDPWPNSPYAMLVCRQRRAPFCTVWPAHFEQGLPSIPVPLANSDADLPLSLQSMIEAIYERGRYHRSIDYSKPLSPPLNPEEQANLTNRLREITQGVS